MKKILYTTLISLIFCNNILSYKLFPSRVTSGKRNGEKEVSLDISGYIKPEAFFDTRQIVDGGEGQYLLFPKKRNYDPCGKDINAQPQLNFSVIESRIRFGLTGPKIFCADTLGAIEFDFFGSERFIGRARIRHAFLDFDWETTTLLLGQYWNPMYVEECSPNTISFDTGAPFDPFARNPQIRVSTEFNNLKLIFAAISQLQFVSSGPIGLSSDYLRNSHAPMMHGQFQVSIDKHILGAGVDWKRLVPRLVSNTGFKVEESINSLGAIAYGTFNFEKFHICTKLIYSENGSNLGTLSGFAVHCIDPVTESYKYTNLRCVGIWLDGAFKHKCVEPGIFVGYTKNIGAPTTVIQRDPTTNDFLLYSLTADADIDNSWRISPRIRWHLQPVVLGAELEYSRATYGTITSKGRVKPDKPVGNLRLLLAAFYFF